MTDDETEGSEIILDWYDGPLLTIKKIDFPRESGPPHSLVEVSTFTVRPPEQDRGSDWASVRISRDDLLKMIDLLDGKPVPTFRD